MEGASKIQMYWLGRGSGLPERFRTPGTQPPIWPNRWEVDFFLIYNYNLIGYSHF
jgi:hypothetical protein